MITIVSGLPRCGTCRMMQMLVAGGMTPLSDGERAGDADNPRGYLEWDRIKTLPNDPSCMAEAEGKVVKVIAASAVAAFRIRVSGHVYAAAPAGSSRMAGSEDAVGGVRLERVQVLGQWRRPSRSIWGSLCLA